MRRQRLGMFSKSISVYLSLFRLNRKSLCDISQVSLTIQDPFSHKFRPLSFDWLELNDEKQDMPASATRLDSSSAFAD
jgi:hypothetical protein